MQFRERDGESHAVDSGNAPIDLACSAERHSLDADARNTLDAEPDPISVN